MKEPELLSVPRILWKRKSWMLFFVLVGVLGGFLAWKLLPPKYRASTMILVESQKVPTDYVKTTVTSSLDERLRTIQQQITNRENLERIILELDLYPELRQTAPMEDVVGHARRALRVRVERGATFRVSFSGTDPVEVARAANRIAELFIDENLKVREGQAERTSQFLETELEEIRGRLEEQEEAVAQFRLRHEGELPEQRDSNLVAISRLEAELEANRESFQQAELRKLLMESELRSQGTETISPATSISRLDELKLELAQLRSRFTDRHPDVVRLQREIAELESRATEPAEVEELPQPSATDIYAGAEIQSLDRDLVRLESERNEILAEMGRFERRLERTPRVQQDLLILTRDYDNLRESYENLLSKRLEARLAENLERSQQGEQFRILERAVPPGRPYFPQRTMCLGGGLLIGLALGLGSAFLREEVDQTFGDPQSLQSAFPGVAVLTSIPLIRTKPGTRPRAPWKEKKTA
ncbi:MAG: GNVR domain-containing protein [Thermoanaerobaculia bacterium]